MRNIRRLRSTLAVALLASAPATVALATPATITMQAFGKTTDGVAVSLFSLRNSRGVQADITNYGGIVTRLIVPDRQGRMGDVVLGYDSLEHYLAGSPYFGAIIGRYGNRIAHGRFSLDGVTYDRLAKNNEPGGIGCNLHGGAVGFDKVVWSASPAIVDGAPALRLTHRSIDGDEGFPGNLEVAVVYTLTEADELRIDYTATTDKPTPVNLTNHSYFNLKGEGEGDILGHVLTIAASRFTPVDRGLIPTGEIAQVRGTPFDFTAPAAIGARIDDPAEQLRFGKGYDHNWVLDHGGGRPALAATVYEPVTGRTLEVWTEEPGVQFYAGNFLNGSHVGKSGRPYRFRNGFCLETQHFPDSPHQPSFPSTILRPGETYRTTTIYKFGAR